MTERQQEIYEAACSFLVEQRITNLPVNPFELIARSHWGLATYRRLGFLSDAAGDCAALFGKSRDGFTIYNGRNYCIAYNDEAGNFNRVLFTLMHEIGHIRLEHLSRLSMRELETRREALDEEANLFASFVLAPSVVIRRCGLNSVEKLRAACGLSQAAAEKRLFHYRGWSPTEADEPVERLLNGYIKANIALRSCPEAAEIVFEGEEKCRRRPG